jgi:hypothetical protein
MQGVLAFQLELSIFGSPKGLQVPTVGSVGFTLTLSPKWGCDISCPCLGRKLKAKVVTLYYNFLLNVMTHNTSHLLRFRTIYHSNMVIKF